MPIAQGQALISLSAAFSNLLGGANPNIQQQLQFALGTSAGQFDLVHAKEYTIAAAGSPQSIDLNGGGLLDPEGNAVNFAKVTAIGLVNESAAQIITVGGGSNPWVGPWSGTVTLGKSGVLAFTNQVDGWAVVAATGDILKLTSDGGVNVKVIVLLLGRTV
jgi:hypothetical protein